MGLEIGHLVEGMHPGVGPAGGDQIDGFSGHRFNLFFQHLLDRGQTCLPLPAVIAAPIIFKDQLDILFLGHFL